MTIKVGTTGHRPHRLSVPEKKLAARIHGVLTGLIAATESQSANGLVLDVISPLAEGSDRIVARQALALGQRLTAIIPFERRAYERTFGDPSTTNEFRALWKISHERAVLKGALAHAEASYVAVGAVTLARSDVILTIWDGKPAQGRGGTPEILQNALEWGLPIIWVHAIEDQPPLFLLGGKRTTPTPRLERIARNGRVLNGAGYREIVRIARNNQTS